MTTLTTSPVITLSDTKCTLGEGAFWHPERQSFFWCDILGHRLYEHDGTAQHAWDFDRAISACAWVDAGRLLIASEVDLILFDLATGTEERQVALEADLPGNRSNDGRADPMGGFWIGTMDYGCAPGKGAIYRLYKGELRRLVPGVGIPNAICFSPDGRTAHYADTDLGMVWRVALDADGWPLGAPEVFLDLAEDGLNPDGAVVDTEGRFWTAQWGAGRVACYGTDGALLRTVDLPATQVTCPAFGGAERRRLFVTSAAEGKPEEAEAGRTFCVDLDGVQGQAEPRVLL